MYTVIRPDGSSDSNPPLSSLPGVLEELFGADREHGDVALVHEDSGWSLSFHLDGRMVLEHLSEGHERHMTNVTSKRALELWHRLSVGDLDTIFAEPWEPGYVSK